MERSDLPKRMFFTRECDFNELKMLRYRGVAIMRAPHVHEAYELYICHDDIKQDFVICGVDYEYSGPCAIISKPYTIHSMSCKQDCETDYVRTVIYFGEGVISEMAAEYLPRSFENKNFGLIFPLSSEDAEYLERVMSEALNTDRELNDSEKKLLFTFLMMRIYSSCDRSRVIEIGEASYYVQDVMKYISEHFDEPLEVSDIAARFAVSRSTIDRDFKKAVGVTPKAFIEECRLNNAKHLLLKAPSNPISDIAALSGFPSETYFYRFFKKKTGLSPNEYRKAFIK